MAQPIKFPFVDSLAHRIANLVTSDIEELEKLAFNMTTASGWQSQFKRPYKAHYANNISKRAHGNPEAMARIMGALRGYEAKAQAYMANPNRRGRPLTQFVHDANAPDTLPDQPYRKSGQYKGPQNPVRTDIDEEARAEMQKMPSMDSGDKALLDALKRAMMDSLKVAMREGNSSPQEIERAQAQAADMTPEQMQEALERARDKAPKGPDGKPIKRFDSFQIPEVKTVPQAVKRDTKETLAQAMKGEAQPNGMDENRVREIADEEINAHVPGMVKAGLEAVAPTLIAEALKKLTPTRVEVIHPDGKTIDLGVQHKQFPMLLKTVTRFPVWLPGPAGSGKTTAAKNAAKALSVPFHHHGAVDNVYQLLGFIDAGGTYHATSFRKAYESGGVFLWDEVDASNPAALVAFNAAIENGECVFPDATVLRHANCYFIAAANTYGTGATHEYVGRTKLDAATLDRFVMLDWNYDEELETAIAGATEWTRYVQRVRARCKDMGIKHLVTPRASIRGNDLLAQGIPSNTVIDMTIRKGLSEDQWSKIIVTVGQYKHVKAVAA